MLLWVLCSCTSAQIKNLQSASSLENLSVQAIQPVVVKNVYRCLVDGKFALKSFHLSGILYLKKMDDNSTRLLFQNEMGMRYFDFSFLPNDSFVVNSVIDDMNKPALIKTLKKDFCMLLVRGMDEGQRNIPVHQMNASEKAAVMMYEQANVFYYLRPDHSISKIENWGSKSKVVTITTGSSVHKLQLADTLIFKHHKANFTIRLTKLIEENVE